MIDFMTGVPLGDAVEQISQRTPVGTRLSSAEWDLAPAEIRLRTLWAARLESEKIAAQMQEKIAQFIKVERTRLAGGGEGVFMDRGLFIEQIRGELKKAGYKPEPDKKGGLQDLTSERRLGLIWKMNLAQAQGYARWKSEMDAGLLEASPAWEFIRLEARAEQRRWPLVWAAKGGIFYPGSGPYPQGRMIALKTDPIWKKINRFGVPWKPFDWGSGMGTRNIRRNEALALGVVKPGDAPQVPDRVPFNAGAEASLKGISPERRRAIEDDFRGDVEIDGDVIRLLPPQGDAMGGELQRGEIPKASFDNINQPGPSVSPKAFRDTIGVAPTLAYRKAGQEVRDAIDTISAVHGDGVLPEIEVILTRFINEPSQAGLLTPTLPGQVPVLKVSADSESVPWSAIHEIGHLLDNRGLHTPSVNRLYASQGQPELKALMQTIRRTRSYHEILARSKAERVDYFVRSQELFARAYTQFIAEESADPSLLETLKKIITGGMESVNVWKESQWNPAQFSGIRKEMREVIRKLKWRYDR